MRINNLKPLLAIGTWLLLSRTSGLCLTACPCQSGLFLYVLVLLYDIEQLSDIEQHFLQELDPRLVSLSPAFSGF